MSKRRLILVALVVMLAFSVTAAAVLPAVSSSHASAGDNIAARTHIGPSAAMFDPQCPDPNNGGCGG
jgi:hypothetical protein